MKIPTIRSTPGILRVIPPSTLLRNLAQVFSNNESWSQVAFPKEIEPAKPLAASLLEAGDEDTDQNRDRHVWTSSRWRKFLALCFCLNVDIAVSCAILVWLCLVCLGIATSGIFGLGGKTYLIELFVHIPVAVFFVVFFFGHHLRSGPQMHTKSTTSIFIITITIAGQSQA
eukprot:s1871_g3.t1